jgi:beta-lactamase superfamily II metal-dependent hydrolase
MPPKKRPAAPAGSVKKAKHGAKKKAKKKAAILVTDLANRDLYLAQTTRPAGSRGDGQLHLTFLGVGQGDCTIITTPQGRVVMVDCGSQKRPDVTPAALIVRMRNYFYTAPFLLHENIIDLLVLTHQDVDHQNKLEQVFHNTGVNVLNVYCSAKFAEYGNARHFLWTEVTDVEPHEVVYNRDPAAFPAGLTQMSTLRLGGIDTPLTNILTGAGLNQRTGGGIKILEEPDCTIRIIAGGVSHDYAEDDNSNEKNRGSLVLSIEFFGRHLLMLGDATISTEKFLLATNPALLAKTTTARIGHHGSCITSSLDAFVRQVNAPVAYASANSAATKGTFNHPHWEVFDRFLEQAERAGHAKDPRKVTAFEYNDLAAGRQERDVDWEIDATDVVGTVSWVFDS